MEEQVEPVYGTDEAAPDKHEYFLNDVRRPERGEAQGAAEKDNNTPW